MKVAVFTMVYNESVFLPMWIAHYAKEFGSSNLFVVDVGSDDGSTSGLDVNVIPLARTALDEQRRTSFVHHFHASLLSYYDVVIFCDTDEFIAVDPSMYSSLRNFLEEKTDDIIAPIGIHVFHAAEEEKIIDRNIPILMQRCYAQFDAMYCKPIIGRISIPWTPGFHHCAGKYALHFGLYLFHLKAVDKDIFISEVRIKRKVGINQESLKKGYGLQMGMQEEQLISMNFPFADGRGNLAVDPVFSFEEDMHKLARSGHQGIWKSKGKISTIPVRFGLSLPALNGALGSADTGSAAQG